MTKSPALVVRTPLLLLFLGLSIAGCGGRNMMMNSSSPRVMEGIQVTPASADAQKFPSGQVQFMATATFNMAPMTVTSPPVMWSIGNPFPSMSTPMPMSSSMSGAAATVTANGLAQCNGFVGIATIQATAPADPSMAISSMNAMTTNVAGMAQMICP